MNETHNSTFNEEITKGIEQLAEQLGTDLKHLIMFIEGNNLYREARAHDYDTIAIKFLQDVLGYERSDKTDELIRTIMDDGLFTSYITAMTFIENNYIGAYSSKEDFALKKLKPLFDTLPDIILANLSVSGVADDLLADLVVYKYGGLIHLFEFEK